jgi:hypothetical protein
MNRRGKPYSGPGIKKHPAAFSLNDHWRDRLTTQDMTDLVSQFYPTHFPITSRPDWRPSPGKPGSRLEDMQARNSQAGLEAKP